VVIAMGGRVVAEVHELGAPHVRCAEHGELTHVETDPTARPTAVALDEHALDEGRSAGEPAGHEHCPFAVVLEQTAPTPRLDRFLIGNAPPPLPAARPADAVTPVTQAPLLLAAPKTSPPLRG
jgi:hypothetical protein